MKNIYSFQIGMSMSSFGCGILASRFQGSRCILQPCTRYQPYSWSPLLKTSKILLPFSSKENLLDRVGQNLTSNLQTRTFSIRKLKDLISSKNTKIHDNVGVHYKLVYNSDTTSYLQLGLGGVQAVVSMFVCTLGAMACGFHPPNIHLLLDTPVYVGIFVVFNMIICISILRVISTTPMRIYYNEDEDQFIAVFVGKHPLDVRLLNIQPGEVKPHTVSNLVKKLVPWSIGICTTHTQKIYLNEYHFKYPVYYNKLLGYDNP